MRFALLPGLLFALAVLALGGNSTAHAAGSDSGSTLAILAQAGSATPSAQATATVGGAITGTATTSGATAASTAAITGTTTVSGTAATTAATITGTNSITPTATTVPLPTVPVQPSAGGGGASLRLNPFDWGFLTSAPTIADPFLSRLGPFSWFGLVLALVLLGGGIYVYSVMRPRWKRNQTVYYRATNRFGPIALWLGVIGLLLVIFRLVVLDFLDMRLWLYLWFLALLVAIGYFVYWYRTSYPQEMARFQKTQRQRQYMPGSGKRGARATAPATTTRTVTTTTATTSTPPARKQGSGSGGAKRRKRR